MSDEIVKVEVVGESASAVAAMRAAANAVQDSVGSMKSQLSGLAEHFGKLNEVMAGVAAILAGGAIFKEAIEETKAFTRESLALGRQMGISATQASIYATALEDIGSSTQEFGDAATRLTRQIKTNETGINDLGIVTRDAQGHLRNMADIMVDAIAVVNSYKEGTDRNLAAQVAFGRGVSGNSSILKLSQANMDLARASAEELGLVVGEQNVRDYKENKVATAEAHDVLKAFGKVIGDAVMPVLTTLAQWLREIGPAAVSIFRVAINSLVTAFWGLYVIVKVVWEVILGMIRSVTAPLGKLGQALAAFADGNWAAGKSALKEIPAAFSGAWHDAFDKIGKDAKLARDKVQALWGDQKEAPGAAPGKDFKGKDPKEKKDHGLDGWNDIYAQIKKNYRETKSVLEETFQQMERLDLEGIANKRAALKEQASLGLISKRDELAQERDLLNQEHAIRAQALKDKMSLIFVDKAETLKVQDEIALEQVKHEHALAQLDAQIALEKKQRWIDFFKSIQSSFATVIQGFLAGTRSFAGLVRGIFDAVVGAVTQMLAQIAAEWIAKNLLQRIIGKTTAASTIADQAASAGAGGVASMAAAPFPLNLTAPAFGASMFASALAYGISIPAAARGYDIPAGLNPLTQLHQREMVLPEKQADVIRGLADGGGGGPPIEFKGHPMPGGYWMMHRNDITKAVQKAMREMRPGSPKL